MHIKHITVGLVVAFMLIYCSAGRADSVYETIEVPRDNLLAISLMLNDLSSTMGVKFSIYNSTTPQIVLSGEQDNVQGVLDIIKSCEDDPGFGDLINISCTLEEVNMGDTKELGINYADGIMLAGQIGFDSNNLDVKGNPLMQWDMSLAPVSGNGTGPLLTARFRDGDGKSKVLVASELSLPNGIKGTLEANENIPVSTSDSGGAISVEYKDVKTKIEMTPTIVEFNETEPWNSKVRVDVNMVIGSYLLTSSAGGTWPELNSREMKTSRIISANNSTYIVAALVRDSKSKSNSGIPVLRNLPLLKYVFGYEYDANVRVVAILKLSAKFVPQNFVDVQDYLDKLKKAASEKSKRLEANSGSLMQNTIPGAVLDNPKTATTGESSSANTESSTTNPYSQKLRDFESELQTDE